MNLEKICNQVRNLTITTGNYIRTESKNFKQNNIEVKGLHDFVTHVDKASEKALVIGLSEILPEAGFITEEKTINKTGEIYNWIIDPLDGTTNFIHSIPCFSISIALVENGIPILGVVYEINLDECFYAWKDSPAYLNGTIIHASEASTIADSLIATGFPYYDYSKLNEYLDVFKYFLENSHGVRRLGSAAVDLAYVACGRFESFFEYSLHAWDVAAGAFIVQQAGGKVCDFKGGDDFIFGSEIIATNAATYDEFMEIFKRISGF
ncbi:MAG: inositol monophosphatase [Bacteroidetes bacterium]|nr:inositol monophosphatase [Bacteroidota bacterium]